MKCDCISKNKLALASHAANHGVTNPIITFDNSVLILSGAGSEGIGMTFICKGDAPKKFTTQKGQSMTILAAFCPFCGEATK